MRQEGDEEMKTPAGWKKLGTYTCRGQIDGDTAGTPPPHHIRLFDGRFDTAWRVTRFEIRPGNVADDASARVNLVGKLQTSNYGGNPIRFDNWHFGDPREIAWATAQYDSNGTTAITNDSLVDEENLIVEDMWVMFNSYLDNNPGNYYIEMTKYKVPTKVAILAMLKNLSMSERLTA